MPMISKSSEYRNKRSKARGKARQLSPANLLSSIDKVERSPQSNEEDSDESITSNEAEKLDEPGI